MKKFKVLYIASAGRSGSTLLDIILGNAKNNVSTGELTYLFSNGYVNNEYCSCQSQIQECEFWTKVIEEWMSQSILTVKDYQSVLSTYLRNKSTLALFIQLLFPSKQFMDALNDTKLLYSLVAKYSNRNVIVDSSKSAQRILFLRKAKIDLTVILLKRKFSNVLNSVKKEKKQNLSAGVEKDFKAFSTWYSLLVWFIDSYMPVLFSINLKKIKISYERLVSNPGKELAVFVDNTDSELQKKVVNRGPFEVNHLCAGNRMRMTDKVWIKKHQ